MARILGVDYEGDVRVSFVESADGEIGIRYSQDIDNTLDHIAAINADGGAQVNDGFGVLKYEFPITLIMEHAMERGLSWEKLAYQAGYDDEWKLMGEKWSKLAPAMKRQYLGVGA